MKIKVFIRARFFFVFFGKEARAFKEKLGVRVKPTQLTCGRSSTNASPVYNTRPVPLEHYIFPAGGEGLHLVVDNKGRFRENNFQVKECRLFAA